MAGGQCPNLTTASMHSVCVSLSAFFIFKVLAKVVPITMDIGYTTKSNPHLNGAHGFCPQSHRNTATFVPIIKILSQSPSPCQPLLTIFLHDHHGYTQVTNRSLRQKKPSASARFFYMLDAIPVASPTQSR